MEKLNKCPACGALRTSFAAICPECGYEYPDVDVSQTTQKFFDQITKYDEAIAQEEQWSDASKSKAGCLMILAWIFFFPIMLGIYLFKFSAKNIQSDFKGHKKMKANAITAFPIPNNRNDLLETAMMIDSQIKKLSFINIMTKSGIDSQIWNKIWLTKFGNIVKKAEIALKGDTSSLARIKELYNSAESTVQANEKLKWIELGSLATLFIIFLVLIMVA